MTCAIRITDTMNEFFVQKLTKSKQDSIYSSLTDDMEVMEVTPVKVASPIRKPCRPTFAFSRRLFSKNNKTVKMNKKKSSPKKNKLGRIRNLFQTFQNKLQIWSQEIRDGVPEIKTPNFTPNRRIRRILGRTPETLYSPFGIETPPSNFRRQLPATDIMEYPFSAFHDWLTPSKRKPVRAKSKIVFN